MEQDLKLISTEIYQSSQSILDNCFNADCCCFFWLDESTETGSFQHPENLPGAQSLQVYHL